MSLQNQRTPLHIAVYRDNVLLMKKLISFGADFNATIVSCSTYYLHLTMQLLAMLVKI